MKHLILKISGEKKMPPSYPFDEYQSLRTNGPRISQLASYGGGLDSSEIDPKHGKADIDPGSYILDFLTFNDQTDKLATIALPSIACIGFFLNLISLLVFRRSSFKSSFYKYIFANTVCDLSVTGLVVLKPSIKYILTEYIILMFVYVYATSVALTCSTATKIVFTLDRLTKSLNRFRFIFKPASSTIITIYCVLSAVVNLPLLLKYHYFDMTWFKQSYYEQTLNGFGLDSFVGLLAMLNAMLMNAGSYVLIVVLSVLLKKAIRDNFRKLYQLLEIQRKRINYETTLHMVDDIDYFNEHNDDDDDLCDVGDTENNSSSSLCHNRGNGKFKGQSVSVKDPFESVEENLKGSPRTTSRYANNPVSLEKERRKMGNMVLLINVLFIFGHTLLLGCSFYEQISNLIYGVAYKKTYEDFGIVNVVANIILYTTMSSSFFAYVYFVRRFRQALVGAFACAVCSLCCNLEQIKKRSKKNFKS
jgi:hypothetical protein